MAWYGSTGVPQNMSSVVDISSASVNATLEHPQERPTSRSNRWLPERTYELEENFPCCYLPLEFFFWDKFPFIKWLRKYRPRTLVSDVIAGLTVGLMVVPQALAYASIAGLPLEVRDWSALALVVVCIHSSCLPFLQRLTRTVAD